MPVRRSSRRRGTTRRRLHIQKEPIEEELQRSVHTHFYISCISHRCVKPDAVNVKLRAQFGCFSCVRPRIHTRGSTHIHIDVQIWPRQCLLCQYRTNPDESHLYNTCATYTPHTTARAYTPICTILHMYLFTHHVSHTSSESKMWPRGCTNIWTTMHPDKHTL